MLRSRIPRIIAVPVAVFLVALAVLGLVNRSPGEAPPTDSARAQIPRGASTEERIRALQEAVRGGSDDAGTYAQLGDAYLQRARETADPSFYSRADGAYREALRRDERDLAAVTGLGTLALARHDFRAGLRRAEEARRLEPALVRSYAVLVDSRIELGQYDEAGRDLQRMVDLKPNLASYARVSYFRELHGDLSGAVEAMDLAAAAGGDAPENVAYVQALLGGLEFNRGRLAAAEDAYRTALRSVPGYVPAAAGLARLDASKGRFGPAIAAYRELVGRLPLPEYAIALGEAELAAGREREGRGDLELVSAEERLLRGAGVNTDVEIAIFEADHGSPDRAVELARRAWEAAPSVRSADALGWALTSAGRAAEGLAFARRALALGSKDPTFLYHAGMSAAEAGRDEAARRWLTGALALNERFSPYHAPRARRALEALS